MIDKKTTWHKIAESAAEIIWQPNNMCLVKAGDKMVTLALFKEHLFAFAHKCPHASGIMANGSIDALGNVVCPLHRYKFLMQNGRNSSGEGYFLKTYFVKSDETGVFIGFETGGLFIF